MYEELYLETDEEVTSAIEKIKKSKKRNIALILPRNAVIGQSIVNLKLIFKQASLEKKQLALVSPDKVTRSLAERIGFPVYASLDRVAFPKGQSSVEEEDTPDKKNKEEEPARSLARQRFDTEPEKEAKTVTADAAGFTSQSVEAAGLEESELPTMPSSDEEIEVTPEVSDAAEKATDILESIGSNEREPESRTRTYQAAGTMIPSRGNLRLYRQNKRKPVLLIGGIVLVALFTAFMAAFLLIPKATVRLIVFAQPLNETVTSVVDTEATEIDEAKTVMPGTMVSLEQETKSSAKATGKKDLGEKATGTISITNAWDSRARTFSVGTKVRAKNGNDYVLTNDVTVPGASSTVSAGSSVITPGKADVAVEASAAGDAYNIAPTTFTFSSLTKAEQEKIYGTSTAAFTGGTSKVVTVVTQSDIDSLSENVKKQNRDDALKALKEKAGESVVIDKAIQTGTQDVASSVAADAEAEAVEITVKGTYSVITFTQAHHTELLQKLLANKIPEGQSLVTQGDNVAIDTSQFELNLVTEKRLELTNTVKAFTATRFDQNAIRRSLIGIPPQKVTEVAGKKVELKDAEVVISPSWFRRLPFLQSKITLDFTYIGKDN